MSVMRRTSYDTMWNFLRFLSSCCLSISCFAALACLLLVCCLSQSCTPGGVVERLKLSYFLPTSPNPITSRFMFYFSSFSSSYTCPSFRSVLTLYVAILSRSPLAGSSCWPRYS